MSTTHASKPLAVSQQLCRYDATAEFVRRDFGAADLPVVQFLGRNHVDDLLGELVDLDHQPVDAADEEHVEDRGGNGHGQSAGRVQQGLGDAAGQQFGPAQRVGGGGDHVERLDHAQHGAHQSQQRADRGHAVEHAEVAAAGRW